MYGPGRGLAPVGVGPSAYPRGVVFRLGERPRQEGDTLVPTYDPEVFERFRGCVIA